jgi:succinate-acetate transporter protein
VSAHLAGWYGDKNAPEFLFPFAAFFGGVGQVIAAWRGYRARDGIATAMHGMWGLFWLGFGFLLLLVANGTLTLSGESAGKPGRQAIWGSVRLPPKQ